MLHSRPLSLVFTLFFLGFFGVRWIVHGAPFSFLGAAPAAGARTDAPADNAGRETVAHREPEGHEKRIARRDGDHISYSYYSQARPVVRGDNPLPNRRTPWSADDFDRMNRDQMRQSALEALRRPGPALCGPAERGNFIATIGQYYATRDRVVRGLAASGGTARVDDDHAWTTPLDKQIDAQVREFFTEGYLQPGDLRSSETVDRVLAGARPRHRVCADAG